MHSKIWLLQHQHARRFVAPRIKALSDADASIGKFVLRLVLIFALQLHLNRSTQHHHKTADIMRGIYLPVVALAGFSMAAPQGTGNLNGLSQCAVSN
jgi:hypothetical protein